MITNGIDIINIQRFSKLITKETFFNKNFTNNEINYIKKTNYNLSTIAGLYASKEAFLKAIKKGINNYSLKDIEINHNEENAPFIALHNIIKKDIEYQDISLSISHDGNYAIAEVFILF